MIGKNYIEEVVSENAEGKGVYEEIAHCASEPDRPVQRFEFERVGFNAVTGEAGAVTITAIGLPDDEVGNILIPDKIECEPDWCEDTVTAPVTAVAAYASSTAKQNDSIIRSVLLPETLKSVGRCAFAMWCDMKKAEIPASVTEIGEYAFGYERDWSKQGEEHYKKIDGFVISCYPDSAGEKYAKDNGFEYKLLSDE